MIISELPADLWKIDGFSPPPFRSPAERRWRQDNNPSAATATTSVHEALDKMPSVLRCRGERGRHPELQGFVRSGRGHHKGEHSFHNQKEK
ncbi:hypothetical protein JWS14_46195 (plasmid) [Rhodococcus koreensis]|nr:hypothetical protein JWS14_46195 [Rhodococcus koreensis]